MSRGHHHLEMRFHNTAEADVRLPQRSGGGHGLCGIIKRLSNLLETRTSKRGMRVPATVMEPATTMAVVLNFLCDYSSVVNGAPDR